MAQSSRRSFLKAASATAAALAVSHRVPAWAEAAGSSSPVRVWATYRDRRYAQGEPLAWKPATEIAADAIALDPGATRQEILGFGAALTDAACYVLSQIPEAHARRDDARALRTRRDGAECLPHLHRRQRLFAQRLQLRRKPEPDPELKKFSIDHDKAYILPMLREARKVNPELFLFSSPWSPPGWMKANGSMLGGAMRKHSFEPYARYFLKFLEGYKADGVAIDAVTVQNEVDADQDGRMPACQWGAGVRNRVCRGHLGPGCCARLALPTKIWVLDHNYNLYAWRAFGSLRIAIDSMAKFTCGEPKPRMAPV